MKILKQHLFSKLVDGVLTALVLNLILLFLALLMPVVEIIGARPGMLIYALVLVAISAIFLESAIGEKFTDVIHARFGIAGGLVGWMVIEVGQKISQGKIASEMGVISFLMVCLVALIFWRRLLPIGAQFFSMVFILCWLSRLALEVYIFLMNGNPFSQLVDQITGFTALAAALFSLVWIFFRSKTPVQRQWAALVLCFSLVTMSYIFRGFLFEP